VNIILDAKTAPNLMRWLMKEIKKSIVHVFMFRVL
jgi:hypothetical protein